MNVNAWCARGETVLFHAARRGAPQLLAALVLAAADPNCRAKDGSRAVQHVGDCRAAKASKALLESAAGDSILMTEALEGLEAVEEPLKRQLCGLLGLFATPDLWSPATAGLGWVDLVIQGLNEASWNNFARATMYTHMSRV